MASTSTALIDAAIAKLAITPEKVFTVFPNFPLELREMIWKEAIPKQRFVHVDDTAITRQMQQGLRAEERVLEDRRPDDYIYSTAPIPAMLHASVESRRIAIESGYILAFGRPGHNDDRVVSFPFHFSHFMDFSVKVSITSVVFFNYWAFRQKNRADITLQWFNENRDVLYFPERYHENTHPKLPFYDIRYFLEFHIDRFENTSKIALQEFLPTGPSRRDCNSFICFFKRATDFFVIARYAHFTEHCT